MEDGDDEEDVEDEELDEVKKKYSAVVVLISVLLCKEWLCNSLCY